MKNEKKTRDKPLKFYLDRNYPITFYPEEEGGFTVEIVDLPGCVTQGETEQEAFEMIADAKMGWIECAYKHNDPIPPPSTEIVYSGKTMLRMPHYLHERLAESAKREDVSLNQYLVALLSERDALKMVQRELESIRTQVGQQNTVSMQETSSYIAAEEGATYKAEKTSQKKKKTKKVAAKSSKGGD